MVPLYYLSLTCRSIPHRRAHKKGRNSHPRDFSSSPTMRLFRLIIYVENKENLTYIASTTTTTTKNRDTGTTGVIVSRGHKYFADTHKKTQ